MTKYDATRILIPPVLVSLALAVALVAPSIAAVVRIELPSDRITAGDLRVAIPQMDQADADAVLGHAPLPGVERRVSRAELLRWAEDLGLQMEAGSLPEAVVFSRRMRRVERDQVRELVVQGLARRYQVGPEQIDVELHGFPDALLPGEPLDFELVSPLSRLGRPSTLALRWTNAQGRSGNLSFRATVRVRGVYAVAKEGIEARTELAAGDFDFREGFLAGNPDEYLYSSESLEGQQLRQSIKAGKVLEKRMLSPALSVKRGELIELHFRSRAVILRTPARAEQSGATGDVIRCRNLQSGTTVQARILDSRQAEVVSFR
jgi:flagella basal body P-ring formation protein FlgA